MRECFKWLIAHEKLVAAITCGLVFALVLQMKFCRASVGPEATLVLNQPEASPSTPPSSSTVNVAGKWEMTIQKRTGGIQTWTLSLEQNGDILSGVINSEGGDLPVAGTIKGRTISLSAQRFGVTVDFPATLRHDDRVYACADVNASMDSKTHVIPPKIVQTYSSTILKGCEQS